MHLLLLFPLALLASTASAQIQNAAVCTQAEAELGVYLKSHETYCSLFYQCLPDLTAVVMTCPEGLLFDDVTRVCTFPERASCPGKQCPVNPSNVNNLNWAHICCDRYIGCTSEGKKYFGQCEPTLTYNSVAQGCVADYICETNNYCRRLGPVNTVQAPCMTRAVPNDPCSFQTLDSEGNDRGTQSCAEGSSYNASLCNCGNMNPNCMKNTAVAMKNRDLDDRCRATMVLDFSTQVPTSYTLKTPSGQRRENNYAIGATGYTPAGSEGVLATDASGQAPKLYFWSFASNMLLGPFGIKVSFRVDNPRDGQTFTVIGNDMSNLKADCQGTLDIKATYRNRQWTFSFKAVGNDWVTGGKRTAEQEARVPASNGYITVSLMFSKLTRSISGFAGGQPWGPVTVGDAIAINNCGLVLGEGLEGRLSDVEFFEACSNENLLQTNIQ